MESAQESEEEFLEIDVQGELEEPVGAETSAEPPNDDNAHTLVAINVYLVCRNKAQADMVNDMLVASTRTLEHLDVPHLPDGTSVLVSVSAFSKLIADIVEAVKEDDEKFKQEQKEKEEAKKVEQ